MANKVLVAEVTGKFAITVVFSFFCLNTKLLSCYAPCFCAIHTILWLLIKATQLARASKTAVEAAKEFSRVIKQCSFNEESSVKGGPFKINWKYHSEGLSQGFVYPLS